MATESDQTNTLVITTIVVVGAFAMISISAMITALVRSEHTSLDGQRPTNADLDTVAALDKQQLATITAPARWVAEPGGKLHIPIDRAMNLVVAEYRKNPAAASPPPPPGLQMTTQPAAGSPPNPTPPGTAQPTPAVPSPATPNPAAPDPTATKRVVPAPTAPGPAPTPAPGGRP
jgi:hypothetical protein